MEKDLALLLNWSFNTCSRPVDILRYHKHTRLNTAYSYTSWGGEVSNSCCVYGEKMIRGLSQKVADIAFLLLHDIIAN